MTHFLSLTCLSYLRSWFLTADPVIAGAERDADPEEPEPEVTVVSRRSSASYSAQCAFLSGRTVGKRALREALMADARRRGERVIDLRPIDAPGEGEAT